MTMTNSPPSPAGAAAPPPRLLEQVRSHIGARHDSLRTERAYLDWVRRFVHFHGRRHPGELSAEHIAASPSSLANDRHVAASTQNQALAAILFLYKEVLRLELPWMDGNARAVPSACR